MPVRRPTLLAPMVLLPTSLAGCGGDDAGFETVDIASGEPVVIGVSTTLEGDLASTGDALRDAAVLAGTGASIAGHEVEFVATDDGCTIDGGRGAAEELVTTDPEDRDPYRTFLRTVFNDAIQGEQQAAFAEQELGAGIAFIVYEAFRYGGAADTFRATFPGELVGDVGFEVEAEFPDVVSQISQANPDVVYFSGFYPTGIPFVEALRDGGYTGPVLAGDAMYDQEMIDGLGELAEQELYVTQPSPPLGGPEFEGFSSRYQEAYGSDPAATSFTAESFDAAQAIILGLQADGVVEETDGHRVDLEALNDAIYDISFDGASGPVRFDDKGDRVAEGLTPVTVFVVRDGVFVRAGEADPGA